MKEDLVGVYAAATLAEAQLLVDRLAEEGIRAHIDNVTSPFDGLTAFDQTKTVRVVPGDEAAARNVVSEFLAETGEE